jgi:hypothetical protein
MLAIVSRAPLLIGRVAAPLPAAVVRLEVHSQLALDPAIPANRIVIDLLAARAFRARVITVSCGGRPNPDT